jgi:hypothetical protein
LKAIDHQARRALAWWAAIVVAAVLSAVASAGTAGMSTPTVLHFRGVFEESVLSCLTVSSSILGRIVLVVEEAAAQTAN